MTDRIDRDRDRDRQRFFSIEQQHALHYTDDSTIQSIQSTSASIASTHVSAMTWQETERLMRLCLGEADYNRLQQAVRVIQAASRRYLQQRMYWSVRQAMIRLQSSVRMRQAKWRFLKRLRTILLQRHAATLVQSSWRRHVARRSYHHYRHAASTIQALARGHTDRRIVQLVQQLQRRVQVCAATRLQATWRMHVCQQPYHALRRLHAQVTVAYGAILQVQSLLRRRLAVVQFQNYCQSAITLQSAIRCYHARLELSARQSKRRIHTAVGDIKTFWQTHESIYDPIAERAAGVAYLVQIQQCHQKFRRIRQIEAAATIIGSAWRRHVALGQFRAAQHAASVIQAQIRRYLAMKLYMQGVVVVRLLQRVMRGHLARRDAAILCTRRRQVLSATCLQRCVRHYLAKWILERAIAATIRLQCLARRGQAMRVLEERRLAAKRIRTVLRGHLARQQFTQLHHDNLRRLAAVNIQRFWRRYKEQHLLKVARHSAVRIQCLYRRHAAMTMRLRQLSFARRLEAVMRGYLERMDAVKLVAGVKRASAATKITATWRAWSTKRRYSQFKKAIITIQTCLRTYRCVSHLLYHQSVILNLQAAIRGHMSRQQAANVLGMAKQYEAVFTIQATIRGLVARRNFVEIATRVHDHVAAATIQAVIRGHVSRLQAVDILTRVKQHAAAVEIQAVVRAHIDRLHASRIFIGAKQYAAALEIQAVTRGYIARCQAHSVIAQVKEQMAAIRLQTITRGYLARCHTKSVVARVKEHAAVLKLQVWLRMVCARRLLRGNRKAAIQVQSMARSRQASATLRRQLAVVVKTQAVTRGHIARTDTVALCARLKLTRAALKIACFWRCIAAKAEYQLWKRAAVTIQAAVRRYQAMQLLKGFCRAALFIQVVIRRFFARRLARRLRALARLAELRAVAIRKDTAAVRIESFWRQRCVRRMFVSWKEAAIIVQSSTRRHQAICWFRKHRSAVVVMQSCCRMYLSVGRLERLKRAQAVKFAVVRIQTATRCHLTVRAFHMNKTSITKVQTVLRARRCRARFGDTLRRHQRAKIIQAIVRGHHRRSEARELREKVGQHVAAVRISHCWRQHLSVKTAKKTNLAATKIQSVVRGYQALLAFEKALWAAKLKKMVAGVVKIQQCWRRIVAHTRYINGRLSAIFIQSAARQFLAKKQLKTTVDAAILIQSLIRCVLCRMRRRRIRTRNLLNAASTFFQKKWVVESAGAKLLTKTTKQDCSNTANATVERTQEPSVRVKQPSSVAMLPSTRQEESVKSSAIMQAVVEGDSAEGEAELQKAAPRIQRLRRRNSYDKDCQAHESEALVLQSMAHGIMILAESEPFLTDSNSKPDKSTLEYNSETEAEDVTKYTHAKGRLDGNHVSMSSGRTDQAISSQAALSSTTSSGFNGIGDITPSLSCDAKCICIQSALRRHLARSRYYSYKMAILAIQRVMRGCNMRRHIRQSLLAKAVGATNIQSVWRQYSARKISIERLNSGLRIQAAVRSYTNRNPEILSVSNNDNISQEGRMTEPNSEFIGTHPMQDLEEGVDDGNTSAVDSVSQAASSRPFMDSPVIEHAPGSDMPEAYGVAETNGGLSMARICRMLARLFVMTAILLILLFSLMHFKKIMSESVKDDERPSAKDATGKRSARNTADKALIDSLFPKGHNMYKPETLQAASKASANDMGHEMTSFAFGETFEEHSRTTLRTLRNAFARKRSPDANKTSPLTEDIVSFRFKDHGTLPNSIKHALLFRERDSQTDEKASATRTFKADADNVAPAASPTIVDAKDSSRLDETGPRTLRMALETMVEKGSLAWTSIAGRQDRPGPVLAPPKRILHSINAVDESVAKLLDQTMKEPRAINEALRVIPKHAIDNDGSSEALHATDKRTLRDLKAGVGQLPCELEPLPEYEISMAPTTLKQALAIKNYETIDISSVSSPVLGPAVPNSLRQLVETGTGTNL